MVDQEKPQMAAGDLGDSSRKEVFDFQVEPNANPIELFELTLPRPPQGTWREKFDIRVDVRFAHMILKFDNVSVRVATRGARLGSICTGCSLLPHSLYGLNPLPSRNVVAVQEKHTQEVAASAASQVQAKVGGLQMFDASASLDAKASGEAARRVERQGVREESVSRVVPRPHGTWELSEPNGSDGCLDGDYLTSRGQYLEIPSHDPSDLPLATVQTNEDAEEIAVELSIEVQPKDLVFHRIRTDGSARVPRSWFQREKINVELIARRLLELTYRDANRPEAPNEVRIKLGRTVLRGKRRAVPKGQ
jgi:hypothetical protein